MDAHLAAALVRQHARTAELMGVDFVPAYRAQGAEGPAPIAAGDVAAARTPDLDSVRARQSAEPKPTPAPVMAAPSPPRASTSQPMLIEPGPAPPRTTSGPAASGRRLPGWVVPSANPGEDVRQHRTRALATLQARYEADAPHQHFITAHHTIVFHDGDPCAGLVFVGEAPGEEEDIRGVPFVGRAGQLLNKMIEAMGLAREQVYICNVLKTRPPNNATPTATEAALCEPYLIEQLAIVQPRVIVTLGLPATRTLLKSDETMGRLRGTWRSLVIPGGPTVPVMPTYHPAYLLRSYTPENRAKVWADLKLAKARLTESA